MGDVIEADLFRQRGQLSRLLAEAMANALKVGLAGGLLEDGFPDFSRFWFCPLYVGARSIPTDSITTLAPYVQRTMTAFDLYLYARRPSS